MSISTGAGREAHGIVGEVEAAQIKQQIITGLPQLQDPQTGLPAVREVFDGALLYPGNANGDAPDLVIGYEPGFRASWQTTLGGVPVSLVDDNNKKWSGDHCITPDAVPGVLFTSFKMDSPLGFDPCSFPLCQGIPEKFAVTRTHVPSGLYFQSRFFAATSGCGDGWQILNPRLSVEEISQGVVDRPVYITGLPRSGTSILTEMLAQHPDLTCHRYSDFPNVWTPYWRNYLLGKSRLQTPKLTERAHRDRIYVSNDSPGGRRGSAVDVLFSGPA